MRKADLELISIFKKHLKFVHHYTPKELSAPLFTLIQSERINFPSCPFLAFIGSNPEREVLRILRQVFNDGKMQKPAKR